MGSLKDPKTWIPHINPKDCSQKVCNIYCTKWCKYVILPSPPPPLSKDDLGGTTISPVVIVIIALIGSFFILIAYYVFISRFCSRNTSALLSRSRGGIEINQATREMGILMDGGEDDHSNHVPWVVLGKGLDEALIKSITMCKYKKGDGLVSCTDCSVCLGEFQEDESVRILPKCSHAFHVYCIDTWLKTHSNCPLCRANIVCFEVKGNSTLISPPISAPPPPTPLPPPQMVTSELGDIRDVTLEIREEGRMKIRRSKSMDSCLCQQTNQAEEMMARQEVVQFRGEARSSSDNVWEGNSIGLGTKRSYSSGRYICLRMDG